MFDDLRRKLDDVRTMRVLLPRAEELAQLDGRSEPGAEDLLLAALELPDGSAGRVLGLVGRTPEDVRRAVAAQHEDALRALGVGPGVAPDDLPPPVPGHGPYRSTAAAQRLFRSAADGARASGTGLRGAWFLVAAAELEHGTLSRALDRLGVDRAELVAAARAVLAETR